MSSQTVLIKPQRGWSALNLGDLWVYRELIYFLTWRDIKVRYKQALLGMIWAVIQPVLTVLVFSFIFGGLRGLNDQGAPAGLFYLSAVLPWTLFSSGLSKASVSLVGSANLITKVYFPRLAIPLSAVLSGLVDFAISLVILVGMMAYYGVPLTWRLAWLPLLVLFALLTALAVGLWLSALNVQYRDVQHIIPFVVMLWMYASPVVYSTDFILGKLGSFGFLYGLNPMAGVIDGFRWMILGGRPPSELLWISLTVVIVLFVGGLFYFRRMETTFADTV